MSPNSSQRRSENSSDAMRPQREEQNREDPDESDHGDDGKLDTFAAKPSSAC